jgi:hypothetical protein
MDNNKKIMILSGAGFGVLALGYLGYNYIDFDDDEDCETMYNDIEKEGTENIKKEIKEEVEEEVEKKKENLTLVGAVKSSWKDFWKKEYDQDKNEEGELVVNE